MGQSESKSVGSSSEDPQLGTSQCEPVTQSSDSDLNHLVDADALDGELQKKLDLKGVGETEKKVSNFESVAGDVGQLCDETVKKDSNFDSQTVDVGQLCDETVKKDSNFESETVDVGQLGDETEKKDSNFEGGSGELSDEGGAPESGEGQWCDVDHDGGGWNGDDEWCNWNENVKEGESDKVGGDADEVEGGEVEKKEHRRSYGRPQQYPLRPEAEDCAFYLKTGTCKFGFNCKFNHPLSRKNQVVKEKVGEREDPTERSGQTECKYYLSAGGCKFGKACKFNHRRGKCTAASILELNFLGLPIRLGEKECPYYMRTGSCKYGTNCKFNHPDPTSVGGSDSPLGYSNGSAISLQVVPQSSVPSWSLPRTLNETVPFVPIMLSPTQAVSPQSSDWNGYQAPVYLCERSMHPPSTYVMNNPAIETNVYMHHQKQMMVEEFPERPGEPECIFFLKNGDCKFKSNCKFHHPKNRIPRLSPCNLSDKGLPLRPDQNVCTHYSRYGICKFGPACNFDHPTNPLPSTGLDHQSSYTNSASFEVAGMGASDATIQQPV